jgi:hypothetical protein
MMCNGYRHLRIEHLPVQRVWPVALWLGRQSASQSREALAVFDVALPLSDKFRPRFL